MMGKRWKITDDDILRKTFEETGKSWEQYVLEDRIEMCCGEGPYLTSRYDVVTERVIPLKQRIGILDRKLRVVNTFVGVDSKATKKEWFCVNLGDKHLLQSLAIYLIINILVNIIKL